MQRPSLSVVIPAYNAEDTVGHAITSVLEQGSPVSEIVVVDDGSRDGTPGAVAAFGDRVRLLEQPNQGSAVARQSGSEASTGDFIAYLDADDWWPAGRAEATYRLISEHRPGFAIGDLRRGHPGASEEELLPRDTTFLPWFEEFARIHGEVAGGDLVFLPPGPALQALMRGFPVYPSTMVVSREALLGAGGWDRRFRRCQDFDVGLRLAKQGGFWFSFSVLAVLGLHEHNVDQTGYALSQAEGDLKVLHAHLEATSRDDPYYAVVQEGLSRKNLAIGFMNRTAGRWGEAARAYRRALGYPGFRVHAMGRWVYCRARELGSGLLGGQAGPEG